MPTYQLSFSAPEGLFRSITARRADTVVRYVDEVQEFRAASDRAAVKHAKSTLQELTLRVDLDAPLQKRKYAPLMPRLVRLRKVQLPDSLDFTQPIRRKLRREIREARRNAKPGSVPIIRR
jgi:hypothetical protein